MKRKYDPLRRRKGALVAQLARKYGVSESTIKRDGKYAEAVDFLCGFFEIEPDNIYGYISKKDCIELADAIKQG